jgi:hypothetical protein
MDNLNTDPDIIISDLKLIHIKLRERNAENGNEWPDSFNIGN